MINCPKCSKPISESAQTCPNCGCNVLQMTFEKKTKNTIITVVVVGLIIALLFGYSQCSNSVGEYSATCEVCHKTYSYEGHEYGSMAQRNVKCIRMTNMCKKCYEAYCWSIGKTPTDY